MEFSSYKNNILSDCDSVLRDSWQSHLIFKTCVSPLEEAAADRIIRISCATIEGRFEIGMILVDCGDWDLHFDLSKPNKQAKQEKVTQEEEWLLWVQVCWTSLYLGGWHPSWWTLWLACRRSRWLCRRAFEQNSRAFRDRKKEGLVFIWKKINIYPISQVFNRLLASRTYLLCS